jgi:hypothetical protein
MKGIKTVTTIEELTELITPAMEKKENNKFDKQARYCGNGVYSWGSIVATDTRVLFLLGVAAANNIFVNLDQD